MKKCKILYSSAEIHSAIKRLFGRPDASDRRVALVAYVGSDGPSYLPHHEGLHVVCSPSAGGTDPDALRTLMKHGAKVEFADRLHMKVYWSRRRGCIVTSANASTNALGVGNLKEAGVLLSPGVVSIDRLLKYSRPRPVSRADLHLLDKQSRARRPEFLTGGQRAKDKGRNFLEWYLSPHRSVWKLEMIEKYVNSTPKSVKEQTLFEYGRTDPHSYQSFSKGQLAPHDWVLDFHISPDQQVNNIDWLYVDFIVKVTSKDGRFYDPRYPYLAIQVHGPSHCPEPPFRITPAFRTAFKRAVKEHAASRIFSSKVKRVAQRLLDLIATEFRSTIS